MKQFHLLSTILLVSVMCLFSCNETDIEEQEYVVTYKVYSNTPDEPITISGAGCLNLVIKDKWEKTERTKDYSIQLIAKCQDRNTLITGEIYVNGKLKKRSEANSYLAMGLRLKGNGY